MPSWEDPSILGCGWEISDLIGPWGYERWVVGCYDQPSLIEIWNG